MIAFETITILAKVLSVALQVVDRGTKAAASVLAALKDPDAVTPDQARELAAKIMTEVADDEQREREYLAHVLELHRPHE